MRARLQKLGRRYPFLRPWVERLEGTHDWSGAKNFSLALAVLAVALLLALNGAEAFERGWWRLGAMYHTAALVLAAYVTVKLVPRMARGTPLRWLFYQVDYKLTREGGVYLVAVFVLMLAALNTGNNLLFIILGSLLAGILVSGVASRTVLTGIELAVELPEHVFARQPVLASLTLRNHKVLLPSFSLTVSGETATNGMGRRLKKRWRREVPQSASHREVLPEPVYFPYIPRHKHSTQQVEVIFPRRGRYAQDAFRVSSKFPFGFLLKMRRLAAASEVVVYPSVRPTEEFYEILPLISGERENYAKGRGHDLYSIRDYQPGDSARHLDWKATAKAQALKVREFAREDERQVELVFDTSLPAGAAGEPWAERFERAVDFCACLAWHFYQIDSQLKFRSPEWETPMASAGNIIHEVLRHLALIEPGPGRDGNFLSRLAHDSATFKVVLTARSRGSIPTGLWTTSYLVFMDSL